MRGIIAGGGTGGHFYPAFAVAKEFTKGKNEIVFAVKKDDISLNALIKQDIPFVEIDMVSFPRTINPLKYVRFLFKLTKSVIFANRIIYDFEPDFIFSTGSYIAFPFIIPAYLRKIPIYIHESNRIFGIGNYISGFFAKKIFLGLPVKKNPFEKKSLLTATPIREIFSESISKDDLKKRFNIPSQNRVITFFGGSQGAKRINEAAYYFVLDNLTHKINNITVIHITGKKNYDEMKSLYETAGLKQNLILYDYYENMNEIYAMSDIVVSRAGSSTISELIQTKTPAILIPLPSSAANHQYENAIFLFENRCAVIVKDDEWLITNIIKNIRFLLESNRLEIMRRSYNSIDIPSPVNSTQKIVKEIIKDINI
ncbi:MAG: UDP-N-acetylglucosamine--N-acetylmuramyl-(pentapeptide) pyrophosphoryl-undecaprenol N-acetylglucosamine transferase [Elusimicrobiales bacterium]